MRLMFRELKAVFLLITIVASFSSAQVYAQNGVLHTNNSATEFTTQADKKLDFTIRFGQGGFKDDRSPVGDLGGGQFAVDIKPRDFPVALSFSSEYYTNSRYPSQPYEIKSLYSVNLIYMDQLFNYTKTDYFLGAGFGRLKVPRGEAYPGVKVSGGLYNLEAGIHIKTFERFGFYGVAKYLHAQKDVDHTKVIDFNETIVMLGLTYRFSL